MKKYITCLFCCIFLIDTLHIYAGNSIGKEHEETRIYLPEPDLISPKPKSEKPVENIGEPASLYQRTTEQGYGIDVSHYQEYINWEKVSKDPNAQYAYLKATEGSSLVDDTYFYNLNEAKRVGIKVGCYHFFSPTAPIDEQLQNLTRTVDIRTQDLIPIIDVEKKGRGSAELFCKKLSSFLKQVELHYKIKPIIYTSSHFYNKYLKGKFLDYKYMIARYHDEEPELVDNIRFVMWQFTSEGRISGIKGPVDRSKFMPNYSINDILIQHK